MNYQDTIFALSSGAGMAGVAVIRVSGGRAGDALRVLTGRELPRARRAVLRRIIDPVNGELVDEALVLWMPGPESFTGEDVAELHVHGGRATVNRVLDVLSGMDGLRPAQAGEFTRRAFESGRMSLMEVEGLADLVRAETEAQRRQALKAARGDTARRVEEWRAGLVFVLSRLEAAIDFCEEDDIAEKALLGVWERMEKLLAEMEEEARAAEVAHKVREGVRVVLAGPPNVGKSSLLNALARREAAIVSDMAGTTRDVLEVRLDLGGIPVILHDTAGLREQGGADEIERIGQEKAEDLLARADMVLWMHAPDVNERPDPPRTDSLTLRIMNKSDLMDSSPSRSEYDLWISVRTGSGLKELEKRLEESIRQRYDQVIPPLVTRRRQQEALSEACANLREALENRERPLELTAELARLASRSLERMVGRVDVEDLLDSIFSEFCIGK